MYDPKRAKVAVRFFEKVLKHTIGKYHGKPFNLAPWQREALETIFGNVDDQGRRIIQQVYLEVPKKAGKSEFAAGMLLLVLVLETAPGAQIYGAASVQKQALNVFRAACKMVEQDPYLRSELRIIRSTSRIVKRRDPDSFYAAVAGDGDAADGMNPLCAVIDEVHRWKTRKQLENWDVLTKGGITRDETLTIAITTAGVQDESPLAWKLHEKTKNIEQGIVSDPRFYGRIYGASPEDDPSSPATWIKANPSLIENGGFLPLAKMAEEYKSAESEGDLASFKRYFLNMWGQKSDRAIELTKWDASRGNWNAIGLQEKSPEDKVRPLHSDMLRRFIDRTCYAGVDLSMTTDLSAMALLFPEGEAFEVVSFFWMPDSNIRGRETRDGVPYRKWAEQGFMELCEGEVIDQKVIMDRIRWASRMFDLKMACFDRYNSREITTQLNGEGIKCVDIPQGYPTLSEPSKKLLELVVTGRLHHGGHPVLRWNASCVSASGDGHDNIMFAKPVRQKDSKRIDGIAAIVDALVMATTAKKSSSIFSDASFWKEFVS